MPYLFDYVEHELETFNQKPFGPVDAAVLSQACMIDGAGVVPEPSALPSLIDRAVTLLAPDSRGVTFANLMRSELFEGMFTGLVPDDIRRLLMALAASPRYRDLRLCGYRSVFDEASRTQFAATTFTWRNAFSFVGFRGTDVSATGWRENFDMAVDPPVPAQRMAADYLASVARYLPRRLYVGGHSKGGNLATYAALRAPEDVRARIECVFDHDGPGSKSGFLDEKDFEPVRGLIHRTVPEESVVGMLMDTPIEPHVVRSRARGAEQHDVFTWEVDGDDFAYAAELSPSAVFTHELMDDWLASLAPEETPRVVDALFRALEASGAPSVGAVIFSGADAPALLAEAARNLDQESRDALSPALGKLAASAARAGAKGLSELF